MEKSIDRVTSVGTDFARLVYYDNDNWMALVQEQKITRILVHAWRPWDQANVQLVFKEQPYAQRIDAEVVQFFLPDARRLGLLDLYYGCLLFSMALEASKSSRWTEG
jgi:hypothetical protein